MNFIRRLYHPLNWFMGSIAFAVVCLGAFLNSYWVMMLGGVMFLLLIWFFPEPEDKDNLLGRVVTGLRIWVMRPKTIWTGLERILAGSVIALFLWTLWQNDFNAIFCGALAVICGGLLFMHNMETLCLSQLWYHPKTHQNLGK